MTTDCAQADVCRLQETKATLADESFYCSGQIDQLQANLADAESFLQAQDGREATAEDRLQETTVSYKKRLSELQGETEQLKSERSVIGRKRKALAELRTRNRDMQAVVNLVKESLLNADDDESTGDATCNSIKHRRVRFENRAWCVSGDQKFRECTCFFPWVPSSLGIGAHCVADTDISVCSRCE